MWLIGDDWRKVPFDDHFCHSSKMATMAPIFDLVSIDFLTNVLVNWSDFVGGSLGVTVGTFLSMTSATAHPTWPLWQPSWIWFLSII
jgi:hypothetical protein